MIEVRVLNKTVDTVITLVRELRAQGLVQGVDFDFAFYQSKWDEFTGEDTRRAIFTFYKDKHATLFALKYG